MREVEEENCQSGWFVSPAKERRGKCGWRRRMKLTYGLCLFYFLWQMVGAMTLERSAEYTPLPGGNVASTEDNQPARDRQTDETRRDGDHARSVGVNYTTTTNINFTFHQSKVDMYAPHVGIDLCAVTLLCRPCGRGKVERKSPQMKEKLFAVQAPGEFVSFALLGPN